MGKNDVFDEIVSKLKQKAFQYYELLRWILRRHEWVKLEDVKEAIQQIKQDYVMVEKNKLENWYKALEPYSSLAFPKFIQQEIKELLRENELG